MGESMKDYERELEASFRTINEGDVIKGTVIDVNEEEVTLDLKYYTQGIIKAQDLSDDPAFSILDDIRIDDEIEATVIKTDDGNGNILLSKKEANSILAWDVLKQLKDERTAVTVKVVQAVNAGVIAYVEGIRGFIPASQLDISYVENTEEYVNKKLTVIVAELNKDKEKLVLSAKELIKEKLKEEHDHKVAMLVPGTIVEGIVESLQTFGAFVDMGNGLSGLVHISQICDYRIRKPSEVLKVGDKVKAKILNTNEGKIALSIKAAKEEISDEESTLAEVEEYSSGEDIGTGLGALLKGIKLD